MSSMLTAVNDFVADSFGTDGYLGLLQYGEHTVMIEKGTNCYIVAVLFGDGNDELRTTIAKQVNLIETTKKSELKNWGGINAAIQTAARNNIQRCEMSQIAPGGILLRFERDAF